MHTGILDALVGALPEPCVVVSSDGTIFAANRAAKDALAIDGSDGATLTANAVEPSSLVGYLRLCARSSTPSPGTLRVRRGSDDSIAFECQASLLCAREGEVPDLVLLRLAAQDSTEVSQLTEEVGRGRQTEARLRVLHEESAMRSEERFSLLVASVKDYGIFMLTPEGRVATWNAGAERLKGYAAPEIIGKHFSVFYPATVIATGKCEMELEGATREGRFEDEGWRLRKDGTPFWANVIITALRDDSGTLLGFAKVTRDLTERKAAEEALRELAAERAILAEKARTQEFQERFLAILGHDLRNPLAAIDMGATLLRTQAQNPAATRILDKVDASTRRMSRMIEQILDLTRSRLTGGLEVNRSPTDLSAMLTTVVEELRTAHPSRTIEVRCEPIEGSWDRDRLEQVFSNLIGNAVHYGSAAAPVTVDARCVGDLVHVEVHNEGPPIPDDLRATLFDPFRRGARDSRTASTAGLGLGLYISRELVVAHGGEIEVRSNAAEGTTFRVTLPRTMTDPHPQKAGGTA